MPIRDVTVTIDLQRPAGMIGFGKPLILGSKEGGADYKEYSDLEGLEKDFGTDTEVYKAAKALKEQGQYAPEIFAVAAYDTAGDPVAKLKEAWEKDWYFLLSTESDVTKTKPLADTVEGKAFKMFATRVKDAADLAVLKAADYERTFVLLHNDAAELAKYPEAAWVGDRGSRPVGSVTWKFSKLTGITADSIDAATVKAINDGGGNVYVKRGGEARTGEGITVSGEFIDVIMAKDWVQVNIENQIQALLNNSPKVPYTNSGIAQLEAATINVLKQGYNQGIIAEDGDGIPLYSTDFPTREQIPAEERAKRKYAGATFTFEIAGAIHQSTIRGTIAV